MYEMFPEKSASLHVDETLNRKNKRPKIWSKSQRVGIQHQFYPWKIRLFEYATQQCRQWKLSRVASLVASLTTTMYIGYRSDRQCIACKGARAAPDGVFHKRCRPLMLAKKWMD